MRFQFRSMLGSCLLAGTIAVAAPAAPASAIVGQSFTDVSLAPYVVMILNRAGTKAGFCSAVVLRRDIILTAAHCVPPGAALRVHFRDENGRPVLLLVEAVVRNAGYRADAVRRRVRSVDLALVRVQDPLPEPFRPANLVEDLASPVAGTRYRVAGYGVTREGEGASSGQLRTGTIELGEPLSPVLLWGRDPDHRGTGACTGDSGGPIFEATTDKVAALTLWSAGNGTEQCGALTQAIWLAPHRAWMAGVLALWQR